MSGQKYLTCCWKEIGPSPDASEAEREVTRCQTCWYDVNGQPDNCGDVYEPRHNEEVSPGTPPTEGVSDDPKSGDNPNPGIPPTGGVVDEQKTKKVETKMKMKMMIPHKTLFQERVVTWMHLTSAKMCLVINCSITKRIPNIFVYYFQD